MRMFAKALICGTELCKELRSKIDTQNVQKTSSEKSTWLIMTQHHWW